MLETPSLVKHEKYNKRHTLTVELLNLSKTLSHYTTMLMTLIERPFSRTTWVNQCRNVSILDFIGAKDGGSGDNWNYNMCKAPVKSSPPTYQHFYRPYALPVT